MSYLDACIAETLRLYNPISAFDRIASEDYVLGIYQLNYFHMNFSYKKEFQFYELEGDTGITIEKGTLVNFDIQSVHHNPEYYPNPHVWDPERFMPENRDNLVPYTYIPFAIGPRNCVGMRFALMEAKTAVVHLINKFKFVKSSNTQIPLKFKKFEGLLSAGDINVGVELRK
jgi:cytochrome P450